ncbi:MAG TPA: hypothetical protein VJ964_12905 [Balneolaceae bacterium]|nr:hypothetical protein [Balneolaceae bacterium]
MSLEDLKEQNILLPEEEWGTHKLETTMAETPLAILFLCSAASWVLAYLGDGNWLTWVGIVTFFVTFFGIIVLCDRAVAKQRKRVKKEKKNS